jgi:endoglucanase
MSHRKLLKPIILFTASLLLIAAAVPILVLADAGANLDPDTEFYVAKRNQGAIEQIAALISTGDKENAELIRQMIETPQSVWFTDGSPKSVQQAVKNTVKRAAGKGTVPVLVAYFLPFRDCSQYSAGGAQSVEEYMAWIDGFAAGTGDEEVVVILEPDGLGIIPWYKQFRGLPSEADVYEWCQPAEADEATAADDRFDMLQYAVLALKANPNALVYLDATHSGWLGSGDAAHRLAQAGGENADGFFLNVSNYQFNDRLEKYGAWVAKCFWFGTDPGSWGNGHFDWCASQYYPATADDFASWALTDQWYADNVESQTWVPYPGDEGLKKFVVDTSRNGQGPWTPPEDHPEGDPQDWCNPPDRGLGYRPTAATGNDLIDAYLWIKIPGESDGECYRWTDGPLDPVRGMEDPPAGAWFPEMALELVTYANPPLD